jgi:hypothetical protein
MHDSNYVDLTGNDVEEKCPFLFTILPHNLPGKKEEVYIQPQDTWSPVVEPELAALVLVAFSRAHVVHWVGGWVFPEQIWML